jgi:hypothetical protein
MPALSKRFSSRPKLQPPEAGKANPYPLQYRFFIWGIIAGAVGAGVFRSPLAGVAFFLLFLNAGLLWRRDEIPILPFCLSYQWLFATIGYLVMQLFGEYPGDDPPANIQQAVILSTLGLTSLALGIRIGWKLWDKFGWGGSENLKPTPANDPRYDLFRVFAIALAANLTGLIWKADPMNIWFNGAQLIYRVLEFKLMFLVLLWLCIFQQQRGYVYGVVVSVVAFASALGDTMSSFAASLMLFFVCLLREWRPWLQGIGDRIRNRQVVLVAGGVAAGVLVMGLVWEGGVKSAWRGEILNEQGETIETARRDDFVATVYGATPLIRLRDAADSVASRMSSDALYFSYVIRRVPDLIPHENGVLCRRALTHVLMPRFLFPNKPNLGSDSWLVIHYAGIEAAGQEQGTSIGLGYIAQFYIDFGVPKMFLPLLLYGMIIGLVYRFLKLVSPSRLVWLSAATMLCFQQVNSYGGEIAKLLGGLLQSVVIYSLILFVCGRWLHRWLLASSSPVRKRRSPLRRPVPKPQDS